MSITIAKGQRYAHADGSDYDVIAITRHGVLFETSEGELVYMDLRNLLKHFDTERLTLSDEPADRDEEDDEEEDDDDDPEEE